MNAKLKLNISRVLSTLTSSSSENIVSRNKHKDQPEGLKKLVSMEGEVKNSTLQKELGKQNLQKNLQVF